MDQADIKLLQMLEYRLEHLSVDSLWARRASGLRGNIIKILGEINAGENVDKARLTPLIERSFEILRHAAQEIPDIDEIKKRYNITENNGIESESTGN